MAKSYFKVVGEFTRRIGINTVVGHPKHPDARGRFIEVDGGAEANALHNEGLIEPISEAAYRKGIADTDRPDAGETMKAQLVGDLPKLSATASTAAITERATLLKVDLAGAKDRGAMLKLVNAASADGASRTAEDGAEGTDNANSRVGTLTNDTTLHPHNSSPQQADPPRDHAAADGLPGSGDELAADEDAAPTGGGEGGDGAPPAQ